MAAFIADDEKPIRKTGHEIGEDLYALSIEDFDERIAILQAEIARLEEARKKKSAQRAAADSVFGGR